MRPRRSYPAAVLAVAIGLGLLPAAGLAANPPDGSSHYETFRAAAGTADVDAAPTAAASFSGVCFADARGDTLLLDTDQQALFARADITEHCVRYAAMVSLSVRVAQPTNPTTDSGWHGATFVGWFIDVTGDGEGEFFTAYHLDAAARLVAEVWDIRDAENVEVACRGTPAYDGETYTATFAPSCIGSPAAVRVQAGMFYDAGGDGDGPVYYDIAPDATFTPPVGPDVPFCFDPPPAPFADRAAIAEVHRRNVDCLYEVGIARGRIVNGQRLFDPTSDVTRGQFSGFLYRSMLLADVPGLPLGPTFSDVPPGHTFEEEIRRLAGGEILLGYAGADRFGPADPVRRDQTASILVRAAEHATGQEMTASAPGVYFRDTARNVHAERIDVAFEQGFVRGVEAPVPGRPGLYDPAGLTTRQQMASVLVRYLEALQG